MLNPERAQELLKEFRLEGDAETRRKAASDALPEPLRPIAYGLLRRDEQGNEYSGQEWHPKQVAYDRAVAALDGLASEDRIRVFDAIFPCLAESVEAGWNLHARLPYLVGWQRKAFRAPGRPELTLAARSQWLLFLMVIAAPYAQPVTWYAAWAPYIGGYHGDALGVLLAAAIERGGPDGEAVFETLLASGRGEHEIGTMGRHVTRGLLAASRPEGWEFIEKMLLAAQRQEGLRQAIFECVDEAHPEAFRRILTLIREHDLLRFSSLLRAVNLWLGYGMDVLTARSAARLLEQIERFLSDSSARAQSIASGTPEDAYLALWAQAFEDAVAAREQAVILVDRDSVEHRFVGLHLWQQLALPGQIPALLPRLEDPDLRIALTAFGAMNDRSQWVAGDSPLPPEAFAPLERLLARLPAKPKALDPLVWEWTGLTTDRAGVADALLRAVGDRPLTELLPYLPAMSSSGRAAFAEQISKAPNAAPELRAALFTLLGDTVEYVRTSALKGLNALQITPDEAQRIERLMGRKAGDLRRGALTLLLAQADDAARDSAARLLTQKDAAARVAGLEMLQQMVKAERRPSECRGIAARHRETAPKTSEMEDHLLDALLDVSRDVPTLDDGLGLFDPKDCTPRITPQMEIPAEPLITPAAWALIAGLEALIEANAEQPVQIRHYDEMLLGNVQWGFPYPDFAKPVEEDWQSLPLGDLWWDWWQSRPADQRDADGLELVRAQALFYRRSGYHHWDDDAEKDAANSGIREIRERLFGPRGVSQKRAAIIQGVLAFLMRRVPQDAAPDLLLRGATLTCVLGHQTGHTGWRDVGSLTGWHTFAGWHQAMFPDAWTPEHRRRLWRLTHWMDKPHEKAARMRPDLTRLLQAYDLGEANDADLLDQLIGPRQGGHHNRGDFSDLRGLAGRRDSPLFEPYPFLKPLVARIRARILEIELRRGELPTAASQPALALRSIQGAETVIGLLRGMDKDGFKRGHSGYGSAETKSKGEVFSHLLRVSFPADADTPEAFAARAAAGGVSEARLVELAVFAPQWALFVEKALGWPEFSEGVWWLHAHTKDSQWSVDQEIRELWTAQAAERTPLSAQSLLDGAVDVAWFHRVHAALGEARWRQIDAAAKYASGGQGHKRAQLYADAMLGRLERAALVERIRDKRHQDSVRALGLLPLADSDDLLDRYGRLQEFLRGSRQFGAIRQANEKQSVAMALENLARTAGYPDPVRLEWAMEARAVQDLADGPVSVSEGPVTVTLAINPWGEPNLAVTKNGKPLQAIPPAAKKANPEIAALAARKTEIERQASRMRLSLEAAMCRGDAFTGRELRELLRHPVLAPMLRSLVLVGADGLAGYPVEDGAALEGVTGERRELAADAALRIAHPHDLLATDRWHEWQRDCFLRERIQPFKQVFRELYVLTDSEKADAWRSQRYAGHQVNQKQAMALLGKRGWVGHPYEGDVRKTFHDAGLTASLDFDYGVTTPAEVEGLTIAHVTFTRRGEWKALDLADVPPRVFSEAMRDLDLVVSVAHQGGVDPEASASTVEMRTAIVREAARLLSLDNVRIQSSHVLIDGALGTYSIHLGSAIVHRQPGGHLCIVPVHSQHRGRVFLPFADDDPRTAEVVSKVLLLAKDSEIKDPTILEQIQAQALRG